MSARAASVPVCPGGRAPGSGLSMHEGVQANWDHNHPPRVTRASAPAPVPLLYKARARQAQKVEPRTPWWVHPPRWEGRESAWGRDCPRGRVSPSQLPARDSQLPQASWGTSTEDRRAPWPCIPVPQPLPLRRSHRGPGTQPPAWGSASRPCPCSPPPYASVASRIYSRWPQVAHTQEGGFGRSLSPQAPMSGPGLRTAPTTCLVSR